VLDHEDDTGKEFHQNMSITAVYFPGIWIWRCQ